MKSLGKASRQEPHEYFERAATGKTHVKKASELTTGEITSEAMDEKSSTPISNWLTVRGRPGISRKS